MSEELDRFESGPYEVMEYVTEMKDDKAVIEINEGEMGRMPIEDIETVENLRESLSKIELVLEEKNRKKEEL